MFDLIQIGTSGLLANEHGLRTVGNNLSNVNTAGFKGSQAQFASLFEQGSGHGQQHATSSGVTTLGDAISFRAGLDQATGNPLDLMIDGSGFFAVRRDDQIVYTRAGAFHFDAQGALVNASGDHVQGYDTNGELADVTLAGLERSMPKATTAVKLSGNVTSTVATPAVPANVNGINVIDSAGATHKLNMTLLNNGTGTYAVTVTDPATSTTVGTGSVTFMGGFPTASTSLLSLTYKPAGADEMKLAFDFGSNVTALASATTLNVLSQDGYGAGTQSDAAIGADGTVTVAYSNGQTATGPRLALANFASTEDLEEAGGSAFALKGRGTVEYGYAGLDGNGSLEAGHLEGSNVDMAEEFSNLILMQRGYQAASHVVSTANDMIQELFDMKGRS
jgi:flagellar hook protein FlgE